MIMVVGKKEKSDIKFDRKATLKLEGKRYKLSVYGDKKKPKRRDVFSPDRSGDSPDTATVIWMGDRYRARLSFRYTRGGGAVPVYTWKVD